MKFQEITNTLFAHPTLKIIQRPDMFNYSLDSVMLASFVQMSKAITEVLDLGSGFAPIPILLAHHYPSVHVHGVELQSDVCEIAWRNVELNGMASSISIVNGNIKDTPRRFGNQSFDMVVCNPPFFKHRPSSNVNASQYKTIARHEVSITLEEIVKTAKIVLKHKGRFVLVHRAQRLGELIRTLSMGGFGIKRMRFVHPRENEPAQMVLVEARKASNDHVHVASPLYVHSGTGYHPDMQELFKSE